MSGTNPAQEAELQRLIAEQEADDTTFVAANGRVSLDAPLSHHAEDGSRYDLDMTPLESGPTASEHSGRIRPEQVREWRALRKDGWSYKRIAEYAGVTCQTIRHHISPGTGERRDTLQFKLAQRFDDLRGMYESGAFLREIAEITYKEVGFRSWQSCYQGLRNLFIRRGVSIRARDASRRARSGRPAPDAPREAWQRFWRSRNQRSRDKRRAERVRCDGLADGRPCRRFAVLGSRFCVSHHPDRISRVKWTREVVIDALQAWAAENDRAPQVRDWSHASDEHPSSKTVIDAFGKWNYALYEAGLRKRKHPKKQRRHDRLARGYKLCDREGCKNTVPPSWRYCRDRLCQDARSTFALKAAA